MVPGLCVAPPLLPVVGPHVARTGVGGRRHVLRRLHAGVGTRVAALVRLEVGGAGAGGGVGAAQLLVHLARGGVVGHVLLHRLHLL